MVVVETFAALGGKRSVRRAPTPRCRLKLVGAAKPQASDEDATRMNGIDGKDTRITGWTATQWCMLRD
jgi:hypothetical protein